MEIVSKIEGTKDFLPEEHKYFTFIKKVFRHEFRKNGFRRISTPIIEKKELFEKSIWKNSNVFSAQMCNCESSEKGDFSLRPELTTGIMRAYLENEMLELPQPVSFYFFENSLRFDRIADYGEIWAEIIGEKDPILDAQLIYITYKTFNQIWLEWKFKVRINSLWTVKDRVKYFDKLKDFYETKKHNLTEESLKNLAENPMQVFNTKNEDERILALEAPKIYENLKKDSKAHYAKVKEFLEIFWVPFIEDHTLVKSADYYTNTVWDFSIESEEKQISLWGGGRYNALAELIGNKNEIPAVWMSLSADKISSAIMNFGVKLKNKDEIDLFFIALWDDAKKLVLPLSIKAREAWINTSLSLGSPSIAVQMKKAQRIEAKYVVIVWIMEAKSGVFQIRNMIDWTQDEIKKEEVLDFIIKKIGKDNLDFYSPLNDLILE